MAELKRARWVARRRRLGVSEAVRVAGALYEHARQTRPEWPTPASRTADLRHHVALAERLRAVARRNVEHLLVTKILAARPKDLEDAREILLGRGGEIDLAAVRGLLEELEAALGQSDLVSVLERLLGEAS